MLPYHHQPHSLNHVLDKGHLDVALLMPTLVVEPRPALVLLVLCFDTLHELAAGVAARDLVVFAMQAQKRLVGGPVLVLFIQKPLAA